MKKRPKKKNSSNLFSNRNILIALVIIILAIVLYNTGNSQEEKSEGLNSIFGDIIEIFDIFDIIDTSECVQEPCQLENVVEDTGTDTEDIEEDEPIVFDPSEYPTPGSRPLTAGGPNTIGD